MKTKLIVMFGLASALGISEVSEVIAQTDVTTRPSSLSTQIISSSNASSIPLNARSLAGVKQVPGIEGRMGTLGTNEVAPGAGIELQGRLEQVWSNFKDNPSQFRANRVIETLGQVPKWQQKDAFNTIMMSDLKRSPVLLNSFSSQVVENYRWNALSGAQQWSVALKLGTALTISPDPRIKALGIGSAFMGTKLDSWKMQNAYASSTIMELIPKNPAGVHCYYGDVVQGFIGSREVLQTNEFPMQTKP